MAKQRVIELKAAETQKEIMELKELHSQEVKIKLLFLLNNIR